MINKEFTDRDELGVQTIGDALDWGKTVLSNASIENPSKDANLLLEIVLKEKRAYLIAHDKDKLSERHFREYANLIKRRKIREPIQHITGFQEFWRHKFRVTGDVLIPRPETEMIVEAAIAVLPKEESTRILEIGIGSGCISISILAERENASALGIDISKAAIEIAKENAKRIGVEDRLSFQLADIFDGIDREKFNLIVSNPPYIPVSDIEDLEIEVKEFDPLIALTDGGDGFSLIRRIVDESAYYLKSGGVLLIEIGVNQAEFVRTLFDAHLWAKIQIVDDLQGIPRMVRAIYK